MLRKCVKVGEGTYGEVYKTNDGVDDVALKVNGLKCNMIADEILKNQRMLMITLPQFMKEF